MEFMGARFRTIDLGHLQWSDDYECLVHSSRRACLGLVCLPGLCLRLQYVLWISCSRRPCDDFSRGAYVVDLLGWYSFTSLVREERLEGI